MNTSKALILLMLTVLMLLAAACTPLVAPPAQGGETPQQPTPNEELPHEVGTAVGENEPAPTKVLPSPTSEPEPEPQPEPEPEPEPEPVPPPLPGAGKIDIQLDVPITVDITGKGDAAQISVTGRNDELSLHVEGVGVEQNMFIENAYFVAAYYVQLEGGESFAGDRYALISYDIGSDDYLTNVYRFIAGEVVYLGNVFGFVAYVNDDIIRVYDFIHAIGSWSAQRDYILTPAGPMDPYNGEYLILHDRVYRSMTTAEAIPVQFLENGKYVNDTLPAGEIIDFMATDGRTYMKFTTLDAREGIIAFTTADDWRQYIDGRLIYECFVEVLEFD